MTVEPHSTRPAATPEQPVVVPAVLPQILLEAINAETLIATINGDELGNPDPAQ